MSASVEQLKRQIQDWTSRKPLIILGSGASVNFNLPSMWALGEHLKNNISFATTEEIAQFERFKGLLNEYKDLERALLGFQVNEIVSNEIVRQTWELINRSDLDAYASIIENDTEVPLEKLISYLLNSAGNKISIITTNYDRIAEYAASKADAFVCTGYIQNHIGAFSNSVYKSEFKSLKGYKGIVNIWKVHGSLDWFKHKNRERHQYFPLRETIPQNYIPSIVTPGLTKYIKTHQDPYRTISSHADTEIQAANGFLCVGYGFNDEHVQPKLIEQIMNDKPIIVLARTLSLNAKNLIIGNNCSEYILIEEALDKNNTKVYTSKLGEMELKDVSYWNLKNYLEILF